MAELRLQCEVGQATHKQTETTPATQWR